MATISVNKSRWILYMLESVTTFLNEDFRRDWKFYGRRYEGFKGRNGQQKLLAMQEEIREAIRDRRREFPPLPLRERLFSVLEMASNAREMKRLKTCQCGKFFVAADTKRKFHNDQCKIDFFNKRPAHKGYMRDYMRDRRKVIKGKKG